MSESLRERIHRRVSPNDLPYALSLADLLRRQFAASHAVAAPAPDAGAQA